MLSTAKAEAVSRDLKQALEKRGQIVVESALPKGRKLTINGNHFSIRIEAMDAVSKDVFGISLASFAFLIADNNESVSFTLGSFLPSFPSNSPFVAREINVV
mgnify:CR=1 FL=1